MAKREKVSQTKRERGRPQKLGEADLERIKELARAGLSVEQIAAEMATSRKSVETLLDEFNLKSEIRVLRASPSAMAKLLIMEELKRGDVATAKWLLERESRLACERERAALLRQQRRVLERAENPEQAPVGLMSDYWQKVDNYFSHRDAQEQTERTDEAGKSDNAGDQTDKTDD